MLLAIQPGQRRQEHKNTGTGLASRRSNRPADQGISVTHSCIQLLLNCSGGVQIGRWAPETR